MSKEKHVPPKGAQEAAKKVLKWKEEHPDEVKAMTKTGWTRARQLAEGKPLSLDIVKRMARFYRHKSNSKIDPKYKNKPWKDRGYVAWLGWGDDVGINWARRIVEREKKKNASKLAYFPDGDHNVSMGILRMNEKAKENELVFNSEDDALQYLSDLMGKRVKIAIN